MQNARLSDRAPLFAEVDVLALGAQLPRRVWGTDVSEGGMFLQTTHAFRVGDKVSLRFGVPMTDAPQHEHEVHVRAAEVRWVRPFAAVATDGALPGIGVRFLSVDPPARAALRHFSRPADRADITLPEHMPSSPFVALPAAHASLAPLTGSIAARCTASPVIVTEEMFAVSIPPFTTPPRVTRTPTGGWRMSKAPQMAQHLDPQHPAPRDVTIGPVVPAAHPLVGWRFERVVFEAGGKDAAPRAAEGLAHSGIDAAHDDGAWLASGAPPPANTSLNISFDDERPIHVLRACDEVTSTPPFADVNGDVLQAREQAFVRGELALHDLPTLTPRSSRSDDDEAVVWPPPRTRLVSRTLPLALGLVVAGACVGALLGTAGRRYVKAPPAMVVVSTAAPTEQTLPSPPVQSVAEMERDVPVLSMPEAPVAVTARAMPAPVAAHTPAPVAVASSSPTHNKPSASNAPNVPGATNAPPARQRVRLDIAIGNASVTRTFTLSKPDRLVVDLSGGTPPAAALDGDGSHTKRVRFGTPSPGTSRVVVELADGVRPRAIEAAVTDGRLALSF